MSGYGGGVDEMIDGPLLKWVNGTDPTKDGKLLVMALIDQLGAPLRAQQTIADLLLMSPPPWLEDIPT